MQTMDLNTPDMWGRYPLYYAIRYKCYSIVQWMLDSNKCDINKVNSDMDVFDVALLIKDPEMFMLLWQQIIPNHTYKYLDRVFTTIDIFKTYLQCSKIISLKDYEHIWCRYAKPIHYKIMIDNNICFSRQMALKYTLIYDRISSFTYLLKTHQHREELNYLYRRPDNSYFNLLHLAVARGHMSAIMLLIKLKADVHLQSLNSKHETVNLIMTLAESKYRQNTPRILNLLMKYLDINACNTQGQTALMMVMRRKSNENMIVLWDGLVDTC